MQHHTKHRKPDKQRVIESYYYEVKARGPRGAYRRTGELYRLSDETIRRYVQQNMHPAVSATDDLTYIPCPGEKPIAPLVQVRSRIKPKRHIYSHKLRRCSVETLCRATRSNLRIVAKQPHQSVDLCHTLPFIPDERPWPIVPQPITQKKEARQVIGQQYRDYCVEQIREHYHVVASLLFTIVLIVAVQLARH